jgi:DUF1009 family protein
MIQAKATCLSITANKTLIFDKEEMLNLANQHKISVIGVKQNQEFNVESTKLPSLNL